MLVSEKTIELFNKDPTEVELEFKIFIFERSITKHLFPIYPDTLTAGNVSVVEKYIFDIKLFW